MSAGQTAVLHTESRTNTAQYTEIHAHARTGFRAIEVGVEQRGPKRNTNSFWCVIDDAPLNCCGGGQARPRTHIRTDAW